MLTFEEYKLQVLNELELVSFTASDLALVTDCYTNGFTVPVCAGVVERYWETKQEESFDSYDEDDGQPSEYDEWQDFYGGDDWDHGQFDE